MPSLLTRSANEVAMQFPESSAIIAGHRLLRGAIAMRKACLAAAVLLALSGTGGISLAAETQPVPAPAPAQAAAAPNILVSGVPQGAPAVQAIIDAAYKQVAAAAGNPSELTHAQWQSVVDAVNAALKGAGFAGAHAYLPEQVVAFQVHEPAEAVAQTAPAAPPAPAIATTPTKVLPPVRERSSEQGQTQQIAVRGFSVEGVGEHPGYGITPASIQQLLDAQLAKLGGSASQPAQLDFDQLQGVADAVTDRYRKAGFIVSTAYLPAQTVGPDDIVHLQVLEGRIGKIEVQGNKHYRSWVIAAPAQKLRGKPLQQRDIDEALLYDRDLPGVSVSSTFQPGEHTGETDLIMVAREAKRPYTFSLGLNNYGTSLTGRYRAEAGFTWNDPLGIGDQLAAAIEYAFDPHQNTYGTLNYSVPTVTVPGLSGVVGASRSELQLNTGPFAALDVRGPTTQYFAGAEWKFENSRDLKMTGLADFIREESQLSSLGFPLSDERFDVADFGFSLHHTDRRFHGMDIFSLELRKSINDDSREPDLVAPDHSHDFLVTRLAYTRVQLLSPTQQLYFKFNGQYTNDALTPLEQFVLGGPDSVRAYPIAQALSDRGYYAALEYHVDAPGFADKRSPFGGQPWRELLTLEAFIDHASGYPAGADRFNGTKSYNYNGFGVGFIFRLPRWNNLLFHFDDSVPIGSREDSHGNQIYARVNLTF